MGPRRITSLDRFLWFTGLVSMILSVGISCWLTTSVHKFTASYHAQLIVLCDCKLGLIAVFEKNSTGKEIKTYHPRCEV